VIGDYADKGRVEMARAAIYCRVSTEDQEREGTSLQSQLAACRKLAMEKGYEVLDDNVFQEARSGAEIDRPKFNIFRSLIREKDVEAAICYSTDRLARNPIHIAIIAEECEKRGISLIFVTEPLDNSSEGQLIRYVRGYAAQIEREKIRERSIRGKREKAKNGRIPGAAKCYGYEYIHGEGRRVVVEDEAEVIRMLFYWYGVEGLSLYRICLRLMDMGIPAPRGGSLWRPDVLGTLLKNERFIGRTYVGRYESVKPKNPRKTHRQNPNSARVIRARDEWIEIPGATPAIVDEGLFEACQQRLQRNINLSRRNSKRPYLLSGFLYCGKCGRRFAGTAQNARGRSKERLYYYCTGTSRVSMEQPCTAKRMNAAPVEDQIWKKVQNMLTKPEMIIAEISTRQEEAQYHDIWKQRLKDIENGLEANNKQEGRLVTLYRYAEIDEDYILRETRKVRSEQNRLEADKARIEAQLNASIPSCDQTELLKEYCNRAIENIEKFSYEDKRQALAALQVKVMVTEDGLDLCGIIPLAIDYDSTTTAVP